jgi:lysine-N-methylase
VSHLPIQLPILQNWSCHSCSGCCKQHGIAITEEERLRIEQQNWTEADGIPPGQPLFVKEGGGLSRRWWRLAHQPDGSCVFLDPKGLCRIHGKFGEAAKPLACRIYPYAFHPAGRTISVGLRFSCPSVVLNLGRPVADQRDEIRELVRDVVPDGALDAPAPAIKRGDKSDWDDVLQVVDALDHTLQAEAPVLVRLLRSLQWIDLVRQATLTKIKGPRLREFLGLLSDAADADIPNLPELARPSRLALTMFRITAGQYARRDAYGTIDRSLGGRWKLFNYGLRLTRGTGMLPPLRTELKEVPFAVLEESFGPLPPESEEVLSRYLRVKLRSLHFCGRAFYGMSVVDGWFSLALVIPSTLWIARWLAASSGRTHWQREDIAQALSFVDHHHGYSPFFGSWSHRRRVQSLIAMGEIPRLIVHYGPRT